MKQHLDRKKRWSEVGSTPTGGTNYAKPMSLTHSGCEAERSTMQPCSGHDKLAGADKRYITMYR